MGKVLKVWSDVSLLPVEMGGDRGAEGGMWPTGQGGRARMGMSGRFPDCPKSKLWKQG